MTHRKNTTCRLTIPRRRSPPPPKRPDQENLLPNTTLPPPDKPTEERLQPDAASKPNGKRLRPADDKQPVPQSSPVLIMPELTLPAIEETSLEEEIFFGPFAEVASPVDLVIPRNWKPDPALWASDI